MFNYVMVGSNDIEQITKMGSSLPFSHELCAS